MVARNTCSLPHIWVIQALCKQACLWLKKKKEIVNFVFFLSRTCYGWLPKTKKLFCNMWYLLWPLWLFIYGLAKHHMYQDNFILWKVSCNHVTPSVFKDTEPCTDYDLWVNLVQFVSCNLKDWLHPAFAVRNLLGCL